MTVCGVVRQVGNAREERNDSTRGAELATPATTGGSARPMPGPEPTALDLEGIAADGGTVDSASVT